MDRKEAIEYAKFRLDCHTKGDGEYTDYGEFLVAAIAALQEPERKEGQWEECDWVDYDGHGECIHIPNAGYVCTNCRRAFKKENLTEKNFCPNCGADMRKSKEE